MKYELLKSLIPNKPVEDIEELVPFKLLRETAKADWISSGASNYFREHNYEQGVWWSADHEVWYGKMLPLKTKTGMPSDDEEKEFNFYNTYMKST